MALTSQQYDPYQALRHREYLWFLLGSLPQPSVILGACITLVVVAMTAWRVPELRKLSRL